MANDAEKHDAPDDTDPVEESIKAEEAHQGTPNSQDIERDGAQQVIRTTQGVEVATSHHGAAAKPSDNNDKAYSSFSTWEKKFIVFTATIASFFSPFTAQIYSRR